MESFDGPDDLSYDDSLHKQAYRQAIKLAKARAKHDTFRFETEQRDWQNALQASPHKDLFGLRGGSGLSNSERNQLQARLLQQRARDLDAQDTVQLGAPKAAAEQRVRVRTLGNLDAAISKVQTDLDANEDSDKTVEACLTVNEVLASMEALSLDQNALEVYARNIAALLGRIKPTTDARVKVILDRCLQQVDVLKRTIDMTAEARQQAMVSSKSQPKQVSDARAPAAAAPPAAAPAPAPAPAPGGVPPGAAPSATRSAPAPPGGAPGAPGGPMLTPARGTTNPAHEAALKAAQATIARLETEQKSLFRRFESARQKAESSSATASVLQAEKDSINAMREKAEQHAQKMQDMLAAKEQAFQDELLTRPSAAEAERLRAQLAAVESEREAAREQAEKTQQALLKVMAEAQAREVSHLKEKAVAEEERARADGLRRDQDEAARAKAAKTAAKAAQKEAAERAAAEKRAREEAEELERRARETASQAEEERLKRQAAEAREREDKARRDKEGAERLQAEARAAEEAARQAGLERDRREAEEAKARKRADKQSKKPSRDEEMKALLTRLAAATTIGDLLQVPAGASDDDLRQRIDALDKALATDGLSDAMQTEVNRARELIGAELADFGTNHRDLNMPLNPATKRAYMATKSKPAASAAAPTSSAPQESSAAAEDAFSDRERKQAAEVEALGNSDSLAALLKVAPGAESKTVEKAAKKLLLKLHPDKAVSQRLEPFLENAMKIVGQLLDEWRSGARTLAQPLSAKADPMAAQAAAERETRERQDMQRAEEREVERARAEGARASSTSYASDLPSFKAQKPAASGSAGSYPGEVGSPEHYGSYLRSFGIKSSKSVARAYVDRFDPQRTRANSAGVDTRLWDAYGRGAPDRSAESTQWAGLAAKLK